MHSYDSYWSSWVKDRWTDRCTENHPTSHETAGRTEADMQASELSWRDPVDPFMSEAMLRHTGSIMLFLFICKDADFKHTFCSNIQSLSPYTWPFIFKETKLFVEEHCGRFYVRFYRLSTLMKSREPCLVCIQFKGSCSFQQLSILTWLWQCREERREQAQWLNLKVLVNIYI